MAQLNQIIAIEKSIKSRAHAEISELYKKVQKRDLFDGFSKTYRKKDEDSEQLPPEQKPVQARAELYLKQMRQTLSELMDITQRKDFANCAASADLVVDGQTIAKNVPVTFLIFLEKTVTDIRSFVSAMPALDETNNWQKDDNTGTFKTAPFETHRTKKIHKPIVLYPATPEHPAQTQLIVEDVIAGFWETVKQSGALSETDKALLVDRATQLLLAIKQAREKANSIEEAKQGEPISKALFKYILGE